MKDGMLFRRANYVNTPLVAFPAVMLVLRPESVGIARSFFMDVCEVLKL